MIKERDYLFDNIKALLIFSTVLAHFLKQNPYFTLDSPGGLLYFIIFTYIMQGFFFISGYFSKNVVKSRDGAVKNLLLPYVLMVGIVSLVSFAICGEFRGDLAEPSFALWFLFAMFVFRAALMYLVKIPGILYLSVALYLLAGQATFLDEHWTGSRICCFFMFFMAGYVMQEKDVAWIRRINHGFMNLIILALMGCAVLISYFDMLAVNILFLEEPYDHFGLEWYEGIGMRIFIALFFFGWMIVFINLMPRRRLWFSQVGQRTMTIYLLHIPVRYAFKYTSIAGSGGVDSYVIAVIAAIAVVYIFSREPVYRGYERMIDLIYRPIDLGWQWIKKKI